MTLGMRKLVGGLALLAVIVVWLLPEQAAAWFGFVLSLFGLAR